MEDNSMYRDLFFEESDTHLESLNEGILQLEQTPDDLSLLDAIFRSAHTLKGMAGTMGYTSMAKLTHKMENVFDLLKREVIPVENDSISLVFDCLDTLSEIVEDLREDGHGEVEVGELVERLDHIADGGQTTTDSTEKITMPQSFSLRLPSMGEGDTEAIQSALNSGLHVYTIWSTVEKDSMMKGVRAYFVLNKLDELGTEVLASEPSSEALENGEFDGSFGLVAVCDKPAEEIQEAILGLNEMDGCHIEAWTLEALTEPAEADKKEAIEDTLKAEPTEQKEKHPPVKKAAAQAIRVPLERLDDLMNMVSELVIHRTRLEDISQQVDHAEIHEPLEQVARISSELQEIVLQLRMQPFSVVVQRFPRMIRDLGKDLGKEFDFVLEGEETELDRTIVSEVGDPLVHLLRNAADHGIESPEEREKAGKPVKGTIKVGAYSEGNRVVITISDDGKGLDPVAIKQSAERKGISTAGLSDSEIQHLIFHPGFSTAQTVTGISGRGVGMDVVKQNIASLSGTIETISTVGQGTTFRITLPLTLSIIQSLIVKSGDQQFALPQSVIEKVEKYDQDLHVRVHQQDVYKYQGKMLPVTDLSHSLNLSPSQNKVSPYVVIALLGDEYHALLIDGVVGQREIVIKELGQELKGMNKFIGATILGSGELLLILDVTAICTEEKKQGVEA